MVSKGNVSSIDDVSLTSHHLAFNRTTLSTYPTLAAGQDEATAHLRALIDKVVASRIDANRRYIDEVLEKIQDENHRYYLEKLATESRMMEVEERAGNLRAVFYHKVMFDTYRSILEKTFRFSP